jgi:hypothetical protein
MFQTDLTKFPFVNPDATKTSVDVGAYQRPIARLSPGTAIRWRTVEHATLSSPPPCRRRYRSNYDVTFHVKSDSGTPTSPFGSYCRGIDTTGGQLQLRRRAPAIRANPRSSLRSYQFEQNPIYAGDVVQLRLIVANTSRGRPITNLQLDYSCEAAR